MPSNLAALPQMWVSISKRVLCVNSYIGLLSASNHSLSTAPSIFRHIACATPRYVLYSTCFSLCSTNSCSLATESVWLKKGYVSIQDCLVQCFIHDNSNLAMLSSSVQSGITCCNCAKLAFKLVDIFIVWLSINFHYFKVIQWLFDVLHDSHCFACLKKLVTIAK